MATPHLDQEVIFNTARKMGVGPLREEYLAQVCGGDEALRGRVLALLQAHDEARSFLQVPAAELLGTVDTPAIDERPGTVIGPYELMEQIGEGGFGLVFVAEQQEPVRRKVALKIIKPGMDSGEVIARFEAERQALALMEHPNIARIFDGGTTQSGRPYFVMELVKGIPIIEYCDQQQLTARQRLDLFLVVCQAVQHAHGKGIIHRDLKPSNILVAPHDGVPVVKVIDFGVAKAIGQQLTSKKIYTRFAQMIGTPLYMSPEQAEINALDIDIRSDVYSLGVLLYELLTGTTPFDKQRFATAAYDEIRRIIKEEEPPKPSTRLSTLGVTLSKVSAQRKSESGKLSALVRGDLDWIVMKALEKERTRRYDTASAMAADVRRFLSEEPVEARPPSASYRLRKFVKRNRGPVVAAAVVLLTVLAGIVGTSWGWVEALAQRDDAVQARKEEGEQRSLALANAAEAKTNELRAKDNEMIAAANAALAKQKEKEANHQRDEVRALADQLRSTLYAAHINLVQNAWDAGGIARVDELLEQHRPKPGESDLRGFEWYYLYRQCHAELLTVTGHTRDVTSVAYSPDGKRLASHCHDGTVKVWDAQTGQELLTFKGFGSGVAFSPDGHWLASFSGGQKGLEVLDVQTGQRLHITLKAGGKGTWLSPAFSPDGKRLASVSSQGTVQVWDAQTGQELFAFEVDHGAISKAKKSGKTIGNNGSLVFSPDGKRLAFASGSSSGKPLPGETHNPNEVKVWDAQTGQELLTLKGHTNDVCSVAFSPDSKRLASGSGESRISGEVKVWDAQTGQELLTFQGHTKGTDSVAFSPDSKRLATSGGGEIKVWNAQTGQELLAYKNGGAGVVFSPDGQRLASARGNTVKVWDAQAGQDLLPFKGRAGSVSNAAFSPDGKRLAGRAAPDTVKPLLSKVADRLPSKVKVWDAQTGRELLTLTGVAGPSNILPAGVVAFSPDGKRLATSSTNPKDVKLWDAQTGQELLTLQGHTATVSSVAFSPDGKRLASASFANNTGPNQGNELKVWDAQTGQELLTLKGHPLAKKSGVTKQKFRVNSVAFSPDGKRLASGGGGEISVKAEVKVRDAQTGQELLTLKGHTDMVLSVAFSPDGKRLASASEDGTVKVWDAQTGQELLTLKGHINYVNSVAFSPDGKRLASASEDGTVKVWDAQTGQELLTFKGAGGGVAFSPDGHRLVSGAADGTLKIWDATPLAEKR